MRSVLIAITLLLLVRCPLAIGTDRFFPDISAQSPSKQYRVEAKSPDNQAEGYKAFQAHFVYTAFRNDNVIWNRRQAMNPPEPLSADSDETIQLPKEGSPVSIRLSDAGWTAIRTSYGEMIFVDPSGVDRLVLDLQKQRGIPKLYFSGRSIEYFLADSGSEYFVIRPWWGRRAVIDVAAGLVTSPSATLLSTAERHEKHLVLESLRRHAMNQTQIPNLPSTIDATYLAGAMKLTDALPLLRVAEQSNKSDMSVFAFRQNQLKADEVDPHSYDKFNLRQVAHLSLRRMGEVPSTLPVYHFFIAGGDLSDRYSPPRLQQPRARAAAQIKVGMSAKQVLNTVGSPDYVGNDTWSYDLDANEPFSLTLTWRTGRVTDIKRDQPALWQSGRTRDRRLD